MCYNNAKKISVLFKEKLYINTFNFQKNAKKVKAKSNITITFWKTIKINVSYAKCLRQFDVFQPLYCLTCTCIWHASNGQ